MRTFGPGAVVAGYRIERRIGTGGMGSVYLAQHPRLPRKDALKILTPGADAEFRARFLREAELAGRLDHPNIVTIYDCGSDAEMLWIAMQFVDGYDAAQLLKQHARGLPAERAVAIVSGAARGLDAAHRAGLLHRDVKPANILIEPGTAAGADRALVTDFGIARTTTESTGPTAVGKVLATLAFAAPEQISGGVLDERTDVYALGGTLYQLLTGAAPFPRETAAAVMHAHLTAPRPVPSAIDPSLPPALDSVVARAMSQHPGDRYAGCGELAAAAVAALHEEPSGPGRRPRAPGTTGGRRGAVLLAAVAGLAAVVAVAVMVTRTTDSGPGAPDAPSTSAAAGSPWQAFGVIVDAFPTLLPATPSGRGYQDLRCTASDDKSKAVPIAEVLDLPVLVCSNGDTTLWATCNSDHSTMPAVEITDKSQGNEAWSRASGTGTAEWKTFDSDGKPRGQLNIRFDAARGFCKLRITGANSGRELYDQWWPTAPI
ncbi:protein kinase [Nocardia sp. SYP-A9097]|uniref:serine/threonine-protein kinase n=1 Tax=Nocardia sp. SYP-A9097 TaxID=2663237 RepID=UPI00129A783C|nr:serine/threonine-protein kinase [Nocardia sp. SYP-A9097]MRH89060.1 protein kinase [Nocardia sp. SYP-A9097]